ncbi:MAG: TrmH family RNA methyltransferase [Gemmatimonadales bacterium]
MLKLVRDLQRRKARERRSLVLLEGWRLVEDAMGADAKLVALLAAEGAEADALVARAAGIDAQTVPRRDFDSVAGTETPGGVMAVAEWEPLTLEQLPAPRGAAVALVLDAVQDPGNVGTMIRTAHALGAWCTIALDGTADVRNPKVLRGAMGSHFRHPVATADFAAVAAFVRAGRIDVCLAATDGAPVGGSAAPAAPGKIALVVGSEGHGARPAWTDLPHHRVSIPMRPGAESLNAAVAAAILLFELVRVGR